MKLCVFEWETVCGEDISPESLSRFGKVALYGKPDPDEVPALVGDAEVVLCSKVVFTADVMDACPNLRYIGIMATGYNNVDLVAARERGIAVTNVPDYSAGAVSQMTLAYLLQFATNLVSYDASVKAGDWTRAKAFCYYPYPMTELEGKTLGLFGLGSIGRRVARLGEAMGMRVIYHARGKKDVPYDFVDRDTLFRESDFLSLHCPLTAETAECVNRESLALMKRSAYLINTARGGLICEKDLADALNGGVIAGFAGDVLTVEPQSADCPLIGAKNCILTPHVAWAPFETRRRLWQILEENLEAFLQGNPKNVVSK